MVAKRHVYGCDATLEAHVNSEKAKSMVSLNLPTHKLSSMVVIWMVIVVPLLKYALVLMPVINALEEKLKITGRFKSIILRTTLVISAALAIIAMAVPFFEYVITLTGSLISSAATITMPCICYLKIFKPSLKLGIEISLYWVLFKVSKNNEAGLQPCRPHRVGLLPPNQSRRTNLLPLPASYFANLAVSALYLRINVAELIFYHRRSLTSPASYLVVSAFCLSSFLLPLKAL
ncbi:hypothetical protein AXF42_Ash020646 [Apostasia shenzhenica]|uniref:Amino acid transporter transmembrane domain-containing protein n=1 Tax=Apostasia shenzhenica TaxID=1088818 RepID=A0A2H9ZY82_9ASPA|nr:hypothetical protein AXF42_Ash020646 [Apostasia shenzhenica]